MKITTLIITLCLIQVSAATRAQITLKEKKASLQKVLETISTQSGYDFVYSTSDLKNLKVNEVNLNNVSIEKALDACFEGQPLQYEIADKTVMIRKKDDRTVLDKMKDLFAIDVRGRVVDENGNPLPGASIHVKGTNHATITDNSGNFVLIGVAENAVLQITYVGYKFLEITAKPELGSLKLEPDNTGLQEVKIVNMGYYSQKKALSTSNVSSVTSKDLQNQPVNNPLLAIAGIVPGIQVTQNNGIPGSGIVVRVQGRNSIDRGNTPFFVVDGVPISNQMPVNLSAILGNNGNPGFGTSSTNGNPLAYLNPADIESIDILKDADATAIYGAQAANGAILITTKKGKSGQSKVDFTLQNGWGKVGHFMDLMKTDEYLAMRREAFKNDGLAIPTFQSNPTDGVNGVNGDNYDLTVWNPNKYTDWQKELIGGTATYQDAQVAFSGGNNNTTFRVNGGYHKETTVFPGSSGDKKGSFSFNLNHTSPNQRLKIQFSGNYLTDQNKLISADLTNAALRLAPNAPDLYNPDGRQNWAQIPNNAGALVSTWTNPLSRLYVPNTLKTINLVSNSVLSYEIIKNLIVKSSFGYSRIETSDMQLTYLESNLPEQRATSQRRASYANGSVDNWIVEPQVSYQTNLGKGILNALLGSTFQSTTTESKNITSSGYSNDLLIQNLASATSSGSSSTNLKYRYNAIFGRINYNWQDKYVVNLTGRRDGTSRFGAESRLHNFWSAGGGWIFSNEDFAKQWNFLSFGKLRTSYGTSGNQQIGDYQYLSLYNPLGVGTAYNGVSALLPAGLSNPYLEWELTKKLSVGAELGFIKDHIQLSVDYFRNQSSNQLVRYTLPAQTGFFGIYTNLPATVQNQGWEFTFSSLNVKSKDWNWRTNFNGTILRNKLAAFPGIEKTSYINSSLIGQPIGIVRTLSYAGVDPATGAPLFYKADGSTTTTPVTSGTTDKIYVFNPFPKWSGGFQSNLSFKQFSLDILLQYVNQQRVSLNNAFDSPGGFYGQSNIGNLPVSFSNRWQKPGDIATLQKLSAQSFYNDNAATGSSLSYTDGSFLRIKNVSLAYQLPQSWQQCLSMKNARIFVNGQNLYTFTKYKGLDPETGALSLPPLRVITLGVQAGF